MEQKPKDYQLIEQVKKSEIEAFKMLFEKYQPILFRNILFQAGDVDTAHDIVQETFIKVWDNRNSLKPNLSFLGLLLKISRNLIRDMAKHQKVRERVDKFIALTQSNENNNPDEILKLTLLEERIIQIINENLSRRCREIFILSRFEGATNQEIAEIFDISRKTVENQITCALKILRKKLRI